jgi:hypothetical protein
VKARNAKWIYQLKITLIGSKPLIWRRILVDENILLSNLHKVIQTAMGWTNSHLHQFVVGDAFYTERIPGDELTWYELNNVDYKGIRLNEVLRFVKNSIVYEYDFGDSWCHEILLEKFLVPDESFKYPVCLSGKMNCPPEDVGGIWEYIDMLKVLRNPNNEEYEGYMMWLDDDFDPKEFDVNKVNKLLARRNFGQTAD